MPKDNSVLERFNRTIQEEFVEMAYYGIEDLNEFNQELTEWLVEYNSVRPHQALDYLTPLEYIDTYLNTDVLPMSSSFTKTLISFLFCYNLIHMTIEYARFHPSIPIDGQNYQEQIGTLIENEKFKTLSEGEHEFDPIPGGSLRHLVTVFENGNGRYRTVSPDGKRFGNTIHLAGHMALPLLGESEDRQHVAIHGLFIHYPGGNPKK
jgi:hypothetical protein